MSLKPIPYEPIPLTPLPVVIELDPVAGWVAFWAAVRELEAKLGPA